jgi:dTDP-4-dehydrorhamnose 3,5-epimerase
MKIIKTDIEGLLIFEPRIFEDERGYFFESFRNDIFKEINPEIVFLQENESKSSKNVLRGLHYQMPPFSQGKLVSVVKGKVWDIAVDLRKNSDTFGKWLGLQLTENNKLQMYIPEGFAHGFLTLEDDTIFQYKCTNYYHKESERAISWNDKTLNIDWRIENPLISEKDAVADNFQQAIELGNIFYPSEKLL